ncbi:transketolase [Patescibacteria group bacterium]
MNKKETNNLEEISKLVKYWILKSTTTAGSGHPTSSLSAAELIIGLMYGGIFKYNLNQPDYYNNDRLIFSKGHASPLFYAAWAATGRITEKSLMTLRKFGSKFEGHPTMKFPYTEAATGSLGQGLSMGLGMALNAKNIDKLPYRTYVLLGDGEMAEGSVWEAMALAAHYKLDNLVAIVDVNRLGQIAGSTMYGHDLAVYQRRAAAFGWEAIVVNNGHSLPQVLKAYEKALTVKGKPTIIIAKTVKGNGVPFLADKDDWHGKALNKNELTKALQFLGPIDKKVRGVIDEPKKLKIKKLKVKKAGKPFLYKEPTATRKAYGKALVRIFPANPNMVVLDAGVRNSTRSEFFMDRYPRRFFEMYIAEQNMVSTALGLAQRGKVPFVSTFAAFFTRAYDQIRMAQYSNANIKFVGSHAGVSIGEDGPSQMGLEGIAMFRSLQTCYIFYPADAVATDRLVETAARLKGMVYLRMSRLAMPIIYKPGIRFPVGGSKVLRKSKQDTVTVVAAGITLYETLTAYEKLLKQNINIRVIDLYSLKPIDIKTLKTAARETRAIITVEDHYLEGGLGEAVNSVLSKVNIPITNLAVRKIPTSGKPEQLLDYENISHKAIIKEVNKINKKK